MLKNVMQLALMDITPCEVVKKTIIIKNCIMLFFPNVGGVTHKIIISRLVCLLLIKIV
mgnify:FL=1